MISMAVTVPIGQNGSLEAFEPEFDLVQATAAQLFGQGLSRHIVARRMEKHLLTERQKTFKPTKRRMLAMRKLRQWQKRKDFRDLVWQCTQAELDSKAPAMAHGVARRAIAGRVDAAKFGLELAGRYTPKGHDQPTAVQIVVSGVPRPQAVEAAEIVDGEVIDEA